MPGSQTPPGRPNACDGASARIALRPTDSVGTRIQVYFAAQWLAYTLPCRRFADILAVACARLGADADRYSFIAVDLHHLLLAGLPAQLLKNSSDSRQDRFAGVTRPLARSRSLILGRSERSVFAAFRAQAREQSFSTESARSRRCWLTAFGPRITLLRAVRSLISNMAAVRSGATSGGKITRCVSHRARVSSTQHNSPAALLCTRALASAGRMRWQRCSNA